MYDRFGELDSYTEINEIAQNLRKEGDRESLLVLCEENGLDTEDGEDFMDGAMVVLTDPRRAALGKLEIESKAFKNFEKMEIVIDWFEYIKSLVMDSEEMAIAVRKKGKSINNCIAQLLKYAYTNRYDIDSAIIKAAGITGGKVQLGMPGAGTAKKIIKKYYMG